MKATIRNVYTVLCILIITVVLVLGIVVMAGYSPKVVLSESMEPEVIRDSLVFVDTHASLSDVSVGDNVVFDLDGVQILHKVREVKSNPSSQSSSGEYGQSSTDGSVVDSGGTDTLIVSGIGSSDETVVTSDMLIGRQSVVFPRIGRYVLWLEKDGMWLAVGVAMVLIVVGCVPWGKRKEQ